MQNEFETESAREEDGNGFVTIKDNPIIRAGVFQYKGSQLPDGDPNQIYNVYRPLEELTDPETLQSFVGLPIIDDHEMLGEKFARSPEERGVHGMTLENIAVRGNDILAPLRIVSRTLKALIDAGKKGLSLGYRCTFEKTCGAIDGITYNYIQRGIRGNHLALVTQGRNGTAVLDKHDVFDHFDLALDTGEIKMADENKDEKTEEKKTDAPVKDDAPAELDLKDVHKYLKKHAPMWKELQTMMADADANEKDDSVMDGDTKEKEGDQKAEDADEKKDDKKEEKKEAMDAADVSAIVGKAIAAERKSLSKTIIAGVTARNELAKSLEPHVGTFACDSMDADDVAAYGCEKLGIKAPKGQEQTAISAFLTGVKKSGNGATFAMDTASVAKPKEGGALASRLAKAAA